MNRHRRTRTRLHATLDALSSRDAPPVPTRQGDAHERIASMREATRLRTRHRLARRGTAEVVVGLVLLAVTPVAWHLSSPSDDFGDPGSRISAPEDPVANGGLVTPRVVDTRVEPEPPGAGPTLDRREAGSVPEPGPTPISEPNPPETIRIARRGIDASVVPVGLRSDGAMGIPHDVRQVGWYEPGPLPGRPGAAVFAGHVDSATQGPGAFFDLRLLELGDEVEVVHRDGSSSTWVVHARQSHRKEDLPIDAIFTADGDPRLVLITCGGDFDVEGGRYLDNVVVHAHPAEGGGGPS